LTASVDPGAALERVERSARALAARRLFLLFSHQAHFASPLVPVEREALRSAPALAEADVLRVIEEVLVPGTAARCAPGAPPAIFFPAPLARALAAGERLEVALERFHYELIRVDAEQRWSWRGLPVAQRTQRFFLEHTRFEAALGRWVFEYRVNDQWWDKSYLEAEVTPFLAVAIEEGDAELRAVLQDGRRVAVASGETCWLDERERLFLPCAEVADALCTEALRFRLLRGADESLQAIAIGGHRHPLRVAAGDRVL
jgi:hypothetical protein